VEGQEGLWWVDEEEFLFEEEEAWSWVLG